MIPTRARETLLQRALDALAAQSLEADRFEVVVVRDGPGGPERAEAPPGLRVRWISLARHAGPATARNAGWRATEAPLVAFTDDDCRPAPAWLGRLLAAAGEHREAFVQGRTEPDPDERHLLRRTAHHLSITAPTGWYETCNVAYPRELLERLGGFEEAFPGPAGEDTDLGLRALESGARAVFAPDALVWHAVLPRSPAQLALSQLRSAAVPLLIARHPGQRRRIWRRVFYKKAHALVLVAALGLAAARRHPAVGLLALVPYVRFHLWFYDRTPKGRADAAVDLVPAAIADAVETAAVLGGAARNRTLVL